MSCRDKSRVRWHHTLIEVDLKVVGCEVMYYIHLAQERDHLHILVNTVMNLSVP
jgi:hypothetical protein